MKGRVPLLLGVATLLALGGLAWWATRPVVRRVPPQVPAVAAPQEVERPPAPLDSEDLPEPLVREALPRRSPPGRPIPRETLERARAMAEEQVEQAIADGERLHHTVAHTARLDAGLPARGMLRKEDIQDAVRSATPLVKKCYDQAIEQNPELGGKLLVQFTLVAEDGSGKYEDAEIIDDELGNPFLGMCVLKALADAEFPAPEGGGRVTVKYPFVLTPAEEGSE